MFSLLICTLHTSDSSQDLQKTLGKMRLQIHRAKFSSAKFEEDELYCVVAYEGASHVSEAFSLSPHSFFSSFHFASCIDLTANARGATCGLRQPCPHSFLQPSERMELCAPPHLSPLSPSIIMRFFLYDFVVRKANGLDTSLRPLMIPHSPPCRLPRFPLRRGVLEDSDSQGQRLLL